MPYNTSEKVIRRMERYLQDMKESQRDILWTTSQPKRLSYRIREAMFACKFHPRYHHYLFLRDFYEISPKEGHVRARYMGEPAYNGDPRGIMEEQDHKPHRQVVDAETPLAVMRLPEVDDLNAVVGAIIKYKTEAEEINFPNCPLTEDEKIKLWKWGRTVGWGFIDHEDEGITATSRPVGELLWHPEEAAS